MKSTKKTAHFVRLTYESETEKAEILGMIADTGLPIGRFVLKTLRNELVKYTAIKKAEEMRVKRMKKRKTLKGADNG